MESFRDAGVDPYQMTQGDIASKVRALSLQPDAPADATVRQMWEALRAGFLEGLIVRLLLGVRDSCQTTLLSEKGHGAGAGVSRRHFTASADTICARQQLSEHRALVARQKEDLEIQRIKTFIDTNEYRQSRVTAANMYCRDIMRQAAVKRRLN